MEKSEPQRHREPRLHPFDALATIGCVYLALLTLGFAAFRYLATLPIGASRNPDRTFFTAANAVSLTGFAQGTVAIRDYPAFGRFVIVALAVGSALTTLIGGGYLLARVVRWKISMPRLVVISIAMVGAPLFAGPLIGGFDAAAAATGLALSVSDPHGGARAFVIGLSTLGLLGVLPLVDLLGGRPGDADARGYLLSTSVAIVLVVMLGCSWLMIAGVPALDSAAASLNLRTLGLAGSAVNATPAMPFTVMALVLPGGAPAGTAGGVGLFPMVIIIRAALDSLRRRAVDPLAGVAIFWMSGFAILFVTAVIAFAAVEPAMPGERLLLLACAAVTNVGVSHEPIGLTGGSLFIVSAMMLAGRLLPLVMLAWMACVVEKTTVAQPSL